MNKAEFLNKFMRLIGVEKDEAVYAFKIFLDRVSETLPFGGALKIPDFGTFVLIDYAKRETLNFGINEAAVLFIADAETNASLAFKIHNKRPPGFTSDDLVFSLGFNKPTIPPAGKDIISHSSFIILKKTYDKKIDEIFAKSENASPSSNVYFAQAVLIDLLEEENVDEVAIEEMLRDKLTQELEREKSFVKLERVEEAEIETGDESQFSLKEEEIKEEITEENASVNDDKHEIEAPEEPDEAVGKEKEETQKSEYVPFEWNFEETDEAGVDEDNIQINEGGDMAKEDKKEKSAEEKLKADLKRFEEEKKNDAEESSSGFDISKFALDDEDEFESIPEKIILSKTEPENIEQEKTPDENTMNFAQEENIEEEINEELPEQNESEENQIIEEPEEGYEEETREESVEITNSNKEDIEMSEEEHIFEGNKAKKRLSPFFWIVLIMMMAFTGVGYYYFFYMDHDRYADRTVDEIDRQTAVLDTTNKETDGAAAVNDKEKDLNKTDEKRTTVPVGDSKTENIEKKEPPKTVDLELKLVRQSGEVKIFEDPNDKIVHDNLFYNGKQYSVQVSSWKQQNIAIRETQKLITKGYNAYILKAYVDKYKSTWFRVRIGGFSGKDEAEKLAKRINNL